MFHTSRIETGYHEFIFLMENVDFQIWKDKAVTIKFDIFLYII